MANNFRTVATKISTADGIKFDVISKKFGVSRYELMQSLLYMLLRYIDNFSSASEEHEEIMKAFFSTLEMVKSNYNPLSMFKGRLRFKSAIVFVEQNKKNNPLPIFISQNEHGEWQETYNLDFMLKALLACIDKDLLDILESEKDLQGYFSLTNALQEIVVKKTDKVMHEEINKLFSDEVEEMFDDYKAETFEEVHDNIIYKRVHHKGLDPVGNYMNKRAKSDVRAYNNR